ncbi:MAG: DNA methyltransferase [Bacteroidia bacterium]|nr:DNA methyltransferase [Bacteroidia bacterium]
MVESQLSQIATWFEDLSPDPEWSFAGLTQKETTYATHSYHRYPAKFIPQLAARLMQRYSQEGEMILDPFMGSGTTLVEAKLLRRPSLGVDINPVAHLIARAKLQAFSPTELTQIIRHLKGELSLSLEYGLFRSNPVRPISPFPERLRYWFPDEVLEQLSLITQAVKQLNPRHQDFFFCALSHSLKSVSYWHDRSIKPTRKLHKSIPPPLSVFFRQVARMEKGNQTFWEVLQRQKALEVPATPYLGDARSLPIENEKVDCIITSPPYVTSYEYADLHQLSLLWFGWADNLRQARERFIGTASPSRRSKDLPLYSPLAESIKNKVAQTDPRKAEEIQSYFQDMGTAFTEMHRVLRRGGYICIVIGNTSLAKVEIKNAQVFAEQLTSLGFQIEKVILREIPSKILPQTRDKITGRFARTQEADFLAYPSEAILIAKKAT